VSESGEDGSVVTACPIVNSNNIILSFVDAICTECIKWIQNGEVAPVDQVTSLPKILNKHRLNFLLECYKNVSRKHSITVHVAHTSSHEDKMKLQFLRTPHEW